MTNTHPQGYIAGVAEWRYPGAGDEPCPAGTQCLILTKLGICVRGMWGDDAIAWAPFPKRNKLKEQQCTQRANNSPNNSNFKMS